MNNIVEFFIAPYSNTEFIFILLEFIAAFFGIVSVYYAKKENILVFPTGIVSTGLYIYLLYRWQLFGDLIINIYYTIMSIYGWYMWLKVIDDKDSHIGITKSTRSDYIKAIAIFVFSSAFVIAVYTYYNVIDTSMSFTTTLYYIWNHITSGSVVEFRAITPYLDTFTTGAAFAAMWMMANKKLENWILWILVNIVSVPLYFIKGFGFTGIQYFVFLVLAFLGYFSWVKILKQRNV